MIDDQINDKGYPVNTSNDPRDVFKNVDRNKLSRQAAQALLANVRKLRELAAAAGAAEAAERLLREAAEMLDTEEEEG